MSIRAAIYISYSYIARGLGELPRESGHGLTNILTLNTVLGITDVYYDNIVIRTIISLCVGGSKKATG